MLAVRPDILDRIQFRGVGRKIFDLQAPFLVANELLRHSTFVRRQPVPDQEQVAWDIAEQMLEEFDHLFGLDGLLENLEVEVPDRDTGDHR